MAQSKVSILSKASEEVAHVAYLSNHAECLLRQRTLSMNVSLFFETPGNPKNQTKPCKNIVWAAQEYRCANFRKKYVIAYLDKEDEVITCDFAIQRNIKY